MSDEKAAMIEILSSILSRLVNVALCLVLTSIALLMLRDRTDLHLGVVALLALVIGILGTIAVRRVPPPPPPVAADLRLVRPLRATDHPEPVRPTDAQAQRLTASAPVRCT
ncbi:hypothetical protein IOD13_05955 [Brevibacterium casei]|nr:hypothetical protein [Brevibacterium casei]